MARNKSKKDTTPPKSKHPISVSITKEIKPVHWRDSGNLILWDLLLRKAQAPTVEELIGKVINTCNVINPAMEKKTKQNLGIYNKMGGIKECYAK